MRLLLAVLSTFLWHCSHGSVASSVIRACELKCLYSNIALPLPREETAWPTIFLDVCDFECRVKACQLGCSDLDVGASACDAKCSSRDGEGIDSCKQGCHAVQLGFLSALQGLVSQSVLIVDVEPSLLPLSAVFPADSIVVKLGVPEATSEFVQELSKFSDIQWYIQSRSAENRAGWRWSAFEEKGPQNASTSLITAIPKEASRKLEVRVAIAFRGRVVVSDTMNAIVAPNKVEPELQLDSHLQIAVDKYAICWKSNRINGKFRVSLINLDGNVIASADSSGRCHLWREMPKSNCCQLTVADVTSPEEAPHLEISVKASLAEVPEPPQLPPDLLLTNGSHVLALEHLEDFALTKDPRVVSFTLPDPEDSITAMVGTSEDQFVIGSANGAIWLVSCPDALNKMAPRRVDSEEAELAAAENNETMEVLASASTEAAEETTEAPPTETLKLRDPDGSSITQIVHDPLQRKVYALLARKGVLRCSLEPAPCTFLHTEEPLQHISVDSWNGFVYYITSNGSLFQAELFSFNATDSYTFERIQHFTDLSPAVATEVDYREQQLVVVLQNGSIFSRDLVSGNVSLAREAAYPSVLKMHVASGRLFWLKEKCGGSSLDEACFYSEEREQRAVHFSRYLYAGKIIDFCFLSLPLYPCCIPAPVQAGLITSDREARVSWKSIPVMPYQGSSGNWRNIDYECRLEASDGSSKQTQHTNGNDLLFPVVPGAEYSATVRGCALHVCSAFSGASNTAFEELGVNPAIVLQKTDSGIKPLDIIGQNISLDGSLQKANLSANRLYAFDNTTQTMYSSAVNLPVLLQTSLMQEPPYETEFLQTASITGLAVLSSKATLFIASAYGIDSYRFTGCLDQTIYSCSQLDMTLCAEVVGLTVDESSGSIFYMTQQANGTVELFQVDAGTQLTQSVATADNFPRIKQILLHRDKLLLLTARGHFGSVNRKLGTYNMNYAVQQIQQLISIKPTSINNLFIFTGSILMGETEKNLLTWPSVTPRKDNGTILYKLLLSPTKKTDSPEDGYKTVSLSPSYALPRSLLESWESAQIFKADITAINAWTFTNLSKSNLSAPTKPPTRPQDTRIFATQQKTVDGARAIISFFWSAPEEWNGNELRYLLNCSKSDESENLVAMELPSTITYYSFAVKSGKVSCAVAAANEPLNVGEYSTPLVIDSSELKPLVRLFAIDGAHDLIAMPDVSDGFQPTRSLKRQTDPKLHNAAPSMHYATMAFIENALYAIATDVDAARPFLVQVDFNNISNVVHKAALTGDLPAVVAIASDWVGYRLLLLMGKSLYQINLDPFLTSSVITPKKMADLLLGASEPKQLTFDPFTNTALILTRNGSIFSYNFSKGVEQNLAVAIPCLAAETVTWITTEFAWNRAASPKIYALTWNGLIEMELNGRCGEVKTIDWNAFGERGLKAMTAFSIADKMFVFVTTTEMLIYRPDGALVPVPIAHPPVRQILAASQSSQPYPDRKCFTLPPASSISFSVLNEGRTGAVLTIDRPPTDPTCAAVSLPATIYDIYFNRSDKARMKHIESYSDIYHVETGSLDKETDYSVQVSWRNRWSTDTGGSEVKSFRTGFGYPSPPQLPQAVSVTPDTMFLMWLLPETLNSPVEQTKYKITQQVASLAPSSIAVQPWTNGGFSASTTDVVSCKANPCRVKIANLRAYTDYKFWVSAIHESHLTAQFAQDGEAMSLEAAARTKDLAGTLRPDNVTGNSLLLRWNSMQPEQPPTAVSIQYKESGGYGEWKTPKNASFDPKEIRTSIGILITHLLSATSYDYRFVAVYKGTFDYSGKSYDYTEEYYQGIQQARTKAGTPTEPQSVVVRQDAEGWIVEWQPPNSDGGSIITSYALEMRPNHTAEWEIAERGLEGRVFWWRPSKIEWAPHWQFRVRAANQEGFGPYKETPIRPEDLHPEQPFPVVLVAISSSCLLFLVMVVAFLLMARRRQMRRRQKPRVDDKSITLEKIGQLDAHAGKSVKDLPPQLAHEIRNLAQIERDKIQILGLLGQGTFGTVQKGRVPMNTQNGSTEVNVAIKMLREKPDEATRMKFLKEAILMNNFDHPNIIKLIGVSFSEEPHCLILELMEGGDLLTFLRDCRPMDQEKAPLYSISIKEILSIMMDIGRGALYLEQVRHVHRDLAARNCLISSVRPNRIAKIGDFGLTKVVQGNDYYQMRGQDFLPFRWLAPEAASLGLFSSKSDVWSYGVLFWEAMMLGDVPHGGLSEEVVHQLVKQGAHLHRPAYCPEPIYKLMEMCWVPDPKERPDFSTILAELDDLREVSEYQNEKEKYPNCLLPPINTRIGGFSGRLNEAFEVSTTSSSSDREQRTLNGISGLTRGLENATIDKASATRRPGRPSMPRNQRVERTKSHSIPAGEELDYPIVLGNQRHFSIPNGDTSAINRITGRPQRMSRQSTLPSVVHDNEAFSGDESSLSQSWAGPNRGVSLSPSGQPSPPGANMPGVRFHPPTTRTLSGLSDWERKPKLSQVSQV